MLLCCWQYMLGIEPALKEVLEGRRDLAAEDADLETLARLMLVAVVSAGRP